MRGAESAASKPFENLKALVVEDETLVSFLVEDMLLDLGCAAIWHAAAVDEALTLLQEHRPDIAVLDVNLGGKLVYPVADRLIGEGIPFIFATGYGRKGIPEPWCRHPVLQKPFGAEALASALVGTLRR
jgi:CheY-like chemotaxis protein